MLKISLKIFLLIALMILTHAKAHAQITNLSNYEISGLWANGSNVIAGAYGSQFANAVILFLSTDNGSTWGGIDTILVNNVSINPPVILIPTVTFFGDSENIYVGIGDCITGGVYVSTNQGESWSQRDTGFVQNVESFTSIGATIFAGTNQGVFSSSDQGKSWSAANTGMTSPVNSVASIGTNLLAGTNEGGIFRSSNNGASWSAADSGLIEITIYSITTIGTYLFAGPRLGGCYVSKDSGLSWSGDTGFTYYPVDLLYAKDPDLFAGSNSGIFVSSDKGITWKDISGGASLGWIFAFAIGDSNLVAGTVNGVWLYPLSQLTAVRSSPANIPSECVLRQNYPNPFNPTTVITYQLPITALVTLKVYDELGRLVRTLVEEFQTAGAHSVTFNASNLSSGVYFYRLSVGSFVNTRKMILIK
jgi:Secretion system C-terminal sorting domain